MKLKNATDEELQMLDNFLLAITGQQFENEKQVILNYSKYMPLLIDVFGETTIEEIKMAYKLAKAGKLTNHKEEQFVLYRELNFASASEVILAFEEYKKEQLGVFIQNQSLFLEEKKDVIPSHAVQMLGLREMLRDSWSCCSNVTQNDYDKNTLTLKDSAINHLTGAFLYEQLTELGLIKLSDDEKKQVQVLSEAFLKASLNRDRKMMDKSYNEIKKLALDFSLWNSAFIVLCKKIALTFQIHKWINEGKYLEEIESLIN